MSTPTQLSTRWLFGLSLLGTLFFVSLFNFQNSYSAGEQPGDALPRISCTDGYTASVYAVGLSGPDSLAFDTNRLLHVVEESAGEVSSIASNGTVTTVFAGLTSPEGIAIDSNDTIWVVEDRTNHNGRLVNRVGNTTNVIQTGLNSPEGVVVGSNGEIFITESDIDTLYAQANPTLTDLANASSIVSRIDSTAPFTMTAIYTATPQISPTSFTSADVSFTSMADLSMGSDGKLYIANELAGLAETETYSGVTATFTSDDVLIVVDPEIGFDSIIENDAVRPESSVSMASGPYPIFIAEEDVSGTQLLGTGRISQIASNGTRTDFCTGFGEVEDVIEDGNGIFFVTEDSTGLVIKLEQTEPVTPTPSSTPASPTETPTPGPSATPSPTPTVPSAADDCSSSSVGCVYLSMIVR